MTKRIIEFTNLAGAECRYARAPVGTYGTIGVGPRKQHLTAEAHAALTAALEELWSIHPWGQARYIVSAGAMVPQSEKRGADDPHVRGLAYDIDAIWWDVVEHEDDELIRTATRGVVAGDGTCAHYIAIQCILARHLGIVLGYDYNAAHHDHWHVDSTRPAGFRTTSRMCVVLLQRCLNEIWGVEPALKVDGKWGPRTRAGWYDSVHQGEPPDHWSDWLLETAKRGLELAGLGGYFEIEVRRKVWGNGSEIVKRSADYDAPSEEAIRLAALLMKPTKRGPEGL